MNPHIQYKERIHSYLALATIMLILSASSASAYPDYQQFVEKHSGKTVNCALCHTNANGPVGKEEGQIGSLSQKDLQALNSARASLEPGMLKEDSPILNRFGNSIIKTLGKRKFVELRSDPAKLAEALDKKSDLDEDGIADAQEYLDGTDPLNKYHGDPFKLFCVNFDRYKIHLALAALAVFLLDWGFAHLITGFYRKSKANKLKAPSS